MTATAYANVLLASSRKGVELEEVQSARRAPLRRQSPRKRFATLSVRP